MSSFDHVWDRICRCAGQTFWTATGLPFTYRVPGDFLRIERDGREVNRSLSRTNFEKAAVAMPADGPSDIKGRQGSASTWAILMDKRIRQSDWYRRRGAEFPQQCPSPPRPGDVGGEEVDAVAVEVSAGAVVVLGDARVGVYGEDLCVA